MSVLVWPFTHPRSWDQVSDQSCGRVTVERNRLRERGFWCFLSGFPFHLSLSLSLHLLPSSLLSGLKQGSESNFFLGTSTSLNHPRVHYI